MYLSHFLSTGVLLWIFIENSFQHPQCLDFAAPFKSGTIFNLWKIKLRSSHEEFQMCTSYQEFGCCDSAKQAEIRIKYEELKKLYPDQNDTLCHSFLSALLCQVCSPYAAHIYDAEDQTTEVRTFPALCQGYCVGLVKKCKPTVALLANDTKKLTNLLNANKTWAFCKAVKAPDVDYCFPKLLNNTVLYDKTGTVDFYKGQDTCHKFCVKQVAKDLYNPITLKHAKDGSHRVFVGEQRGKVWLYSHKFKKLKQPFLDIHESVFVYETRYDEKGFLDIEFHPDFKNNGRFFICYTLQKAGMADFVVTVNEMRVSSTDMNVANVSSEKVLMQMQHFMFNHNGGQLLFDDDGYLIISTGDGGGTGDPRKNGQKKKTLLGKMLRIDVDNEEDDKPYAIPPDNPFVNKSAYMPEIYSLGIRNVWRCSKDRGGVNGTGKGRIFCGDVGQSKWEQIIILKPGANYGWNIFEGSACYDQTKCKKKPANYTAPIHTYPHSVGKSVTGGYVYRGCENPHWHGLYIFGDYHNGRIFALQKRGKPAKWKRKEFCLGGANACINGGLSSAYTRKILAFGEDESGELYMLSTASAVPGRIGGSVYKLVDPLKRGNPAKCLKNITRETIINTKPKVPSRKPPTTKRPSVTPPGNRGRQTPAPPQKPRKIQAGIARFGQDGPTEEGVVMVTDGINMGLICADITWNLKSANVVCRMLGFEEAVAYQNQILLDVRFFDKFLANLHCVGNEANLADCPGARWQTGCYLYGDAKVTCKKKVKKKI